MGDKSRSLLPISELQDSEQLMRFAQPASNSACPGHFGPRVLSAHHRPCKEVVVPGAFGDVVEVDVPFAIARKGQRPADLDQRPKPQLELGAALGGGIVRHGICSNLVLS